MTKGAENMNIVFIMADQLGAASLQAYGSEVDSTPTLARLADAGVRFDRCYATCPVCAPNRATILTGRSPTVHGLIRNNYALRSDMPTYAHVLRAHGYRTGGFGKFHQSPMPLPPPTDLTALGFDESADSEDVKWGPWLDWIEREHPEHFETALGLCWSPGQRVPASQRRHLVRWEEARRRILDIRAASEWSSMYASPLPAELHDTTFITNRGLDFMTRHRRDYPDRPFFCHISYVDPHDPYDPPAPYDRLFDPADMPAPLPAEWREQGPHCLEACGADLNFADIADKPDVVRRLRALYHGSLKYMDDQIARIADFLTEQDLWADTILVFTTDHGEMLGDHGLITKGCKHYDAGIRCPLIVHGGGLAPAVDDRLTCSLDFFPTFADWAGIELSELPPLEGRSFAACDEPRESDEWPEVAVAFGEAESIITADRWRLTRFVESGEAQMFDLRSDPHEQRNLADDPAHAARRTELLERLLCAATRPHRVPHYRNMSSIDGRRWYGGDSSLKLTAGSREYLVP